MENKEIKNISYCDICGKEVEERLLNNAAPLNQLTSLIKKCCRDCNFKYVLRARLFGIGDDKLQKEIQMELIETQLKKTAIELLEKRRNE